METRGAQRRGMLLLLCCAMMWSISGVLIKRIPWNAAVIAGFRSLLAGGVMALYIRAGKVGFRVDRVAVRSGLLMSGMFLCFTMANKLTTAANAIVIQSSAPTFVLVYHVVFRGQRADRADIITVLATLAGIAIFFLDQLSPGRMAGNALALLSGVLLAATYVVTCAAPQRSCMNGILLAHVLTACVGIPLAFVFATPWTGAAVGGIALLGVVQLGIPYVLYGLAVQHCPPLAASLICMAEAVFNPIWVFLFTGEMPGALSLAGGALVLCAIALWAVHTQRRARGGPQGGLA